jgi:hypothetical protein
LFAAVLISCQDVPQSPGRRPLFTGPNAAISDGAPFFYFRSPLVEEPSFSGTFNAGLPVRAEVCQLVSDTDLQCVGDPVRVFDTALFAIDETNQLFHYSWNTDEMEAGEDEIDPTEYYRLSVWVQDVELGYRDLDPAFPEENPTGQKTDPFYAFRLGSNIPIKFTVLEGALCSINALFCDECTVHSGATPCQTPDAGVEIASGALDEGTIIVVEQVDCDNFEDGQGRLRYLPIDIPQYGGCFQGRTIPEDADWRDAFPNYVVGICIEATGLGSQEDRLNIHRTPDRTAAVPVVEALPNTFVPTSLSLSCTSSSILFEHGLSTPLRWAYRGWRAVERSINPLHAKPVYATHSGFGGKGKELSAFDWAIPSEMEAVASTDNQVGLAGSTLPNDPTVFVFDEDGTAVEDAFVTFEVGPEGGTISCVSVFECTPLGGGALEVVTNGDGEAAVSFELGASDGSYTLIASGFGIAGEDDSGPFVDDAGGPVALELGTVTFNFTACTPGTTSGGVTIDGEYDASEWACAIETEPFDTKLSGGTFIGTLLWMTSEDNLYIAMKVDRDGDARANILSIYLDDDNDGLSENDDALVLDGDLPLGSQFSDQHVISQCLRGNGQAFCGDVDTEQHGLGAFQINTIGTETFYYYEIAKPWDTNDGEDIYIDDILVNGLRMNVSLRYGNGPQGGTVWPEHGDIQTFDVIIPPTP